MDLETLENKAVNLEIPDDEIKMAFYSLIVEVKSGSPKIITALDVLKEHRPEVSEEMTQYVMALRKIHKLID